MAARPKQRCDLLCGQILHHWNDGNGFSLLHTIENAWQQFIYRIREFDGRLPSRSGKHCPLAAGNALQNVANSC
jgi:hypothetical protein